MKIKEAKLRNISIIIENRKFLAEFQSVLFL